MRQSRALGRAGRRRRDRRVERVRRLKVRRRAQLPPGAASRLVRQDWGPSGKIPTSSSSCKRIAASTTFSGAIPAPTRSPSAIRAPAKR